MAKVAGQCALGEFGNGTGQLDAGRATDDDEGQQPPPLVVGAGCLGAFECEQDTGANAGRIFDDLEAGREFLPILPEIEVARSGGDDEIVIGETPIAQNHLSMLFVDAGDGPAVAT